MGWTEIDAPRGRLPVWFETPAGEGPWPAVVVIHDARGRLPDLEVQARWLAEAGFAVAIPDLFHGPVRLACVVQTLVAMVSQTGRTFADIAAVRTWLLAQPGVGARVGVLGFCMGGGFAILLSRPEHGFDASSVNYGIVPPNVRAVVEGGCPMIASYGEKDWMIPGQGRRLEAALKDAGVPHRRDTYPAGHSFLNTHTDPTARLMALTGLGFHGPSADTARPRIVAFLHEHLGDPSDAGSPG